MFLTGFHEIHTPKTQPKSLLEHKKSVLKGCEREKTTKENLKIKKIDILTPRKSVREKGQEILEQTPLC